MSWMRSRKGAMRFRRMAVDMEWLLRLSTIRRTLPPPAGPWRIERRWPGALTGGCVRCRLVTV